MLDYEEIDKIDKVGKTIAQIFSFFVALGITYLLVMFFGVDNWIRNNTVWLMAFIVAILGVFINNLAEWIVETRKHHRDLLFEKIDELELDINYIKNSIIELKSNNT